MKILLNKIITLLMFAFLFFSCGKQQKPITFTGQLLLSKKYPVVLSNKNLKIYQQGNGSAIGLNTGSTASSANGTTNADGRFEIIFRPGTSNFIFLSGQSTAQITLQSGVADTSFPTFSREYFPDSAYNPSTPTYVGKIIDSAIIRMNVSDLLTPNDTIGLQIQTINGAVTKNYTALAANTGTTIILDTIYNVLLTNYNCVTKSYYNTLYAGKKATSVQGYSYLSSSFVYPSSLSAEDESKVELIFYYKN